MVIGFTTWPETSGNGAAIGIALIITRRSQTKAKWRAIPRGRIHHSILPSLTRRNGSIAADRFFVISNIARATLWARVARVKSTPAPIIWAFVASNHLHGRRPNDYPRCSSTLEHLNGTPFPDDCSVLKVSLCYTESQTAFDMWSIGLKSNIQLKAIGDNY